MNPFISFFVNSSTAPFLNGSANISSLVEGTDAVMADVTFKDGEYKKALEAFYTELERIKRYGITEGELERAKEELKMYAERQYTNRNDVRNDEYAQRYLDFYAQGSPMMDAETEWQLDQQILASLSVDMVNQMYLSTVAPDQNLVILARTPEKENLEIPTSEAFLAVIDEVKAAEVAPYKDNAVVKPLIDPKAKLKGSKVKATAEQSISTIGLDGILYFLGLKDSRIE